jgi:hypothetical protein
MVKNQTKKLKHNTRAPSCGCQIGGAINNNKTIATPTTNNVENSSKLITNNKKVGQLSSNISTQSEKKETNEKKENKPMDKPENKSKNKPENKPVDKPVDNKPKKRNLKDIKPEDINSMSNEELESLISNNPDIFGGIQDTLKDFKENKDKLETAELEKSVFNLDKKIKNSSEKISSIMNHINKNQRERTEGYYIIGFNIHKILNYLFKNSKTETNNKYKAIGEYVNVDPDKINMLKPRFITKAKNLSNKITNKTTLKNIIVLSEDYNSNRKITPNGLLTMTRYLFANKKDETQWLKVVELMEIIYRNIGEFQSLSREEFFEEKTPISLDVILELEEIFNTQHIFQDKPTITQEVYEFYSRI